MYKVFYLVSFFQNRQSLAIRKSSSLNKNLLDFFFFREANALKLLLNQVVFIPLFANINKKRFQKNETAFFP